MPTLSALNRPSLTISYVKEATYAVPAISLDISGFRPAWLELRTSRPTMPFNYNWIDVTAIATRKRVSSISATLGDGLDILSIDHSRGDQLLLYDLRNMHPQDIRGLVGK